MIRATLVVQNSAYITEDLNIRGQSNSPCELFTQYLIFSFISENLNNVSVPESTNFSSVISKLSGLCSEFVSEFGGNICSISEMNCSLIDSEERAKSYIDTINSSVQQSNQNQKERLTDKMKNKYIKFLTEQNNDFKFPIYCSNDQQKLIHKTGIESGIMNSHVFSEGMSKLSESIQYIACSNTAGSVRKDTKNVIENSVNSQINNTPYYDLTIDYTETAGFTECINDMINQSYLDESNLIGSTVLMAIGSGVLSLINKVSAYCSEKRENEIIEENEKFYKKKSLMEIILRETICSLEIAIVNFISNEVNKIYKDSEWWMKILNEIGDYNVKHMIILYIKRYNVSPKFLLNNRNNLRYYYSVMNDEIDHSDDDPECLIIKPTLDQCISKINYIYKTCPLSKIGNCYNVQDISSCYYFLTMSPCINFALCRIFESISDPNNEGSMRLVVQGGEVQINPIEFSLANKRNYIGYYKNDEFESFIFEDWEDLAEEMGATADQIVLIGSSIAELTEMLS